MEGDACSLTGHVRDGIRSDLGNEPTELTGGGIVLAAYGYPSRRLRRRIGRRHPLCEQSYTERIRGPVVRRRAPDLASRNVVHA